VKAIANLKKNLVIKTDVWNGTPIEIVPVVRNGKVLNRYYVDFEGNIYSTKSEYRWPGRLTIRPNSSGYPQVTFSVYGVKLHSSVHRIVAESLLEMPAPKDISEKDWENTPESVKRFLISSSYQVNHIDHNKKNFHPSNLEWLSSGKENVAEYHKYRVAKKV